MWDGMGIVAPARRETRFFAGRASVVRPGPGQGARALDVLYDTSPLHATSGKAAKSRARTALSALASVVRKKPQR